MSSEVVVHTVGHSTRTIDEFLELLRAHRIELLIDVRRFPGSRRHPHFGSEQLAGFLERAGIVYQHMEALGGRRAPRPDSPHDAWRNPQFRGYADHMDTAEFQEALGDLIDNARARSVVIMCAEAVPWQCHRQLISDALVARGVRVRHIIQADKVNEHALSEHARALQGGRVIYPGSGTQLDLL